MRKLVALLLALCLVCGSAAISGAPTWPDEGIILGNTGLKVILPEGVAAAEITEEIRQEGAIAYASAVSETESGGFTLIVNEMAETPEHMTSVLAAEMENIAALAGLTTATMRDRWMLAVGAYGDAVYVTTGSAYIGNVTIEYVRGVTYKGAEFLFAGLQDEEKAYYLFYSMNKEYAQKLQDVLTMTVHPCVDESTALLHEAKIDERQMVNNGLYTFEMPTSWKVEVRDDGVISIEIDDSYACIYTKDYQVQESVPEWIQSLSADERQIRSFAELFLMVQADMFDLEGGKQLMYSVGFRGYLEDCGMPSAQPAIYATTNIYPDGTSDAYISQYGQQAGFIVYVCGENNIGTAVTKEIAVSIARTAKLNETREENLCSEVTDTINAMEEFGMFTPYSCINDACEWYKVEDAGDPVYFMIHKH